MILSHPSSPGPQKPRKPTAPHTGSQWWGVGAWASRSPESSIPRELSSLGSSGNSLFPGISNLCLLSFLLIRLIRGLFILLISRNELLRFFFCFVLSTVVAGFHFSDSYWDFYHFLSSVYFGLSLWLLLFSFLRWHLNSWFSTFLL